MHFISSLATPFRQNGNPSAMAKHLILVSSLCLTALTIFLFSSTYMLVPRLSHSSPTTSRHISAYDLRKRRTAVEDAFQHAWDGYDKYCFGHDTLHPVSNTCGNDFGGWGASAIDALSTAIIMEKEDIVLQILTFIASLDFDKVVGGHQIFFFEVVIRHFGGMISAWDLLNGPFQHIATDAKLREALKEKMIDLGDRLSCAFNSPTGIPHDWLDPAKCKTDLGATTALTTPGTAILEFSRLSAITGDDKYVKLAKKAERYLLIPQPAGNEPFPGLLGSHININDGNIMDATGSWGAFSDSFYEYLLKAHIYDSDENTLHLERWLLAADSTMQHIGRHPYGHPEWTLLPAWYGPVVADRMETLAWFAGGNFILGGMVLNNSTLVDFGLSIADAAGELYSRTATGLGGEFLTWTTCNPEKEPDKPCDTERAIWVTDGRYQLRPEVLETWYHAYRATGDEKYLDWSWKAFQSILNVCKTDTGFSGISDVNVAGGGIKLDKQESFVFAEVLKYLYLMYLEDDDILYQIQDSRTGKKNTMVFNTEAHPFFVAGTAV